MSSLYPSLEDMQVHKMVQAQQNAIVNQMAAQQQQQTSFHALQSSVYGENAYPSLDAKPIYNTQNVQQNATAPELYPGLSEFMGMELSALNMPEYMQNALQPSSAAHSGSMIAPLSQQTAGLQRAKVTHGIREVTVCKGTDKKIGVRVKDINNGIFITLVCKDSPAALVGYDYFDLFKSIFH